MEPVTIHKAKATLSHLIEAALSGEEVVISRRNRPLVRIVPLEHDKRPRRLGTAKGKIIMAADFDAMPDGFEDYLA